MIDGASQTMFLSRVKDLVVFAAFFLVITFAPLMADYECCQPCNDTCCDFPVDVHFDVMWLKASGLKQDYLAIAAIDNSDANNVFEEVTPIESEFKWTPNFQLGFTSQVPCSCWFWGGNWTYLHAKTSNCGSARTPGDNVALTVLSDNIAFGNAGAQSVDLNLATHFKNNLLDFFIGKSLTDPCNTLQCILTAGARGVIRNDHFNSNVEESFFFSGNNLTDLATSKFKNSYHYYALGLYGGFEADARLDCGFSLFGRGQAAWVWGHAHSKSKGEMIHTLAGSLNLLNKSFKESNHTKHSEGMAAFQLGVQWKHCFSGLEVLAEVGWDSYYFFDSVRLLQGDPTSLSYQGVGVRLGVGF